MAIKWTKDQQKVIDLRNRNILVSAAAGSGKTAVLVERIIAMITDPNHPVDLDKLLVVTFTKAAAAEMKERVGRALEQQMAVYPENDFLEKQSILLASAQITTIDSFCLYILRNHFNEIDIDPSFRIADETELVLLKSDVMEQLMEDMYAGGDEAFEQFVTCYGRGKSDKSVEQMISQIYEYSRSYPWPEEWLDQCLVNLDIDNEEDLQQIPLIEFLLSYIHDMATDLLYLSALALDLCLGPDGPWTYEEALQQDVLWLSSLEEATSLEEIKELLNDLKWEALSRKKVEAKEEYKEIIKAIRKTVKDSIKKLNEKFFYTDIDHMLGDIALTKQPMEVLINLVKEYDRRFQQAKTEKNILDFGDLEHFALNILVKVNPDGTKQRTDTAKVLSQQFEEVMCDEYQDSNMVQETILKAVSREDEGQPNVFMVGDVKQSIYKFRQARPELFIEKYQSYSESDSDYQKIDLHKNFRSRENVVDFVNLIFEHTMGTALGGIVYDTNAALHYGANFPETDENVGGDTEIIIVENAHSDEFEAYDSDDDKEDTTASVLEARSVVRKIKEMMDNHYMVYDGHLSAYRPLQYGDIVILMRSMSGWSDVFVEVLKENNIDVTTQQNSEFFSTLEIQTIMSILKVVDNPMQDIELAAAMKSCVGHFNDEELAIIRSVLKKGAFYNACVSFLKPESDLILENHFDLEQCGEIRSKLTEFLGQIEDFKQKATYLSIHQLIRYVFDVTGYDVIISAMPGGSQRQNNLELLIEKAIAYEKTSYKGLFNFIRYVERLKSQNADIGQASAVGENNHAVRIVSIHRSKGLEYPVVFVCGMNRKFNQQDIRQSVLLHPEDGLGPESVSMDPQVVSPTLLKRAMAEKIRLENLAEELRVLYVALTRAKEKLILIGSTQYLDTCLNRWNQMSYLTGEQLSQHALYSANSYMDWIMPVLCCGRYTEQSQAQFSNVTINKEALWQEDVMDALEEECQQEYLDELVQAADTNENFEQTSQWMEEHLLWQYPYKNLIHLPAKITVTQLKHMSQEEENQSAKAEYLQPVDEPETEEIDPEEKEKHRERAALRGTAVHKVMELMDFTKEYTVDEIKDFIAQCVQQGFILEEISEDINPNAILKFCQSTLGKRMAKAQMEGHLYREQQFMMGMDFADVYNELPTTGELILTQGIIDVWFEEDDHIVLVDYKTDYVVKGQEAVLAKRYKGQLDCYKKALENYKHMPVTEQYIYAFGLGETISL